jgi:hypothetical protein
MGTGQGMRINGDVATYWASVVLAVLTIVLVVVNFVVLSGNQTMQIEANQRQQFINQSIQLKRVDDLLIRTLASAAVNAKDDKLRDLLTQQGVTLTPTANEPTPEPTSTAPAAAGPAASPAMPAAPPAAPTTSPANKTP